MREINNNSNVNFPKVDRRDIPPVPESELQEQTSPQSVTEDLSLQPGAVIGRSMVSMTGATRTDNLGEDMKVVLDKPATVEKANKFFDVAYKQLKANGSENPYEEATELTDAFRKDFLE